MNISEHLLPVGKGSAVAVIQSGLATTYDELRRLCQRYENALLRRGLRPGDRVGLLGPNSPGWIAAYLAVMRQGLIAVPVPLNWSPAEVGVAATAVDCRLLVTGDGAHDQVPTAWADRVLAGPGGDAPSLSPAATQPDDDAALMFTSGTTGRPRAVRVTHRNLIANTESILAYLRLGPDDRMLVILPFSYCYGASLLHTHLRAGAAVVLCNTFAFPEVAVKMLAEHHCTGFAGVPSSYQLMLRASTFQTRPLPALRRMLQAGGKMHDTTIDAVRRAQPEADLYVMYGQTEATARLSYLPPEYLSTKRGSIGRGIPGVHLRVVDAGGHQVPVGEVGEILATGDNISPGYLDDADATAQRFDGPTLHTGDMARVDADGFIYVVGRTSDFIKTWGYRVSALEVESALMQQPGVVAAAVFGVPDDDAGEAIAAAVTVRPDSVNKAELRDRCRRTLPRHLTPKYLDVVDQIPLNAAGKVDKATLAARCRQEVHP